MACQNTNAGVNHCEPKSCETRHGSGYIIIIVLYILLAIILGSCIW